MANYAIDDHVVGPGSVEEVAADLETLLETIDDSKTIHSIDFLQDSRNKDEVVAVLIIDA